MPTTTPFDNLITFSRGSNATLVGPNGLVQWAPSNLLTFSEQFDNAAWVRVATTITVNAAVAPDGTTTADKLIATATASTLRAIYTNVPAIGAFNYVFSFYAKASEYSLVRAAEGASARWFASFDLTNGSVVAGTTGGSQFVSASASAVGNGWYRCAVAFVGVVGASAPSISGYPAGATLSAFGATYAGDGTSGVLIWGAQLELGSAATTYNPTTVKNLLGFSEAFDNAAWTKTNSSIVTGAQANPVNGLFNAQKLMENTAANIHYTYQASSVTPVTGNTLTVSAYAKAAERRYVTVGLSDISVGNVYAVAVFDLLSGVVTISGASGTGYSVTATSITAVGNGWYRCSTTCVVGSSVTFIRAAVGINRTGAINTTAGGMESYTGDGNSGVFIYGAQLSDSASLDPYVPTPGAAPSSTAYYGPRFDYDPVTRAARGILIEEQRTNLTTYSGDTTNAVWVTVAAAKTSTSNADPFGTNTALLVTADGTNTSHYVQQGPAISFTSGTTYTQSIWVKAGTIDRIQLTFGSPAFGSSQYANFFLSGAGSVTAAVGGTATIAQFSDGWYRVTFTATATATTSIQGIFIIVITSGTDVRLPNNTSSGTLLLYGAQLEVGAFATSYIPTIASTVTRSADVATITGQNFGQFYRQDEGCLVVEGSVYSTGLSGNRKTLAAITEGNFNNASRTAVEGATSAGASVISGGVTQAAFTVGSAVAANTPFKMALAMKANDFAFCANGGAVSTDTSGSVVSAPIVLDLGFGPQNSSGSTNTAGDQLNGWLRNIRFIPVRAADFQLQALTT